MRWFPSKAHVVTALVGLSLAGGVLTNLSPAAAQDKSAARNPVKDADLAAWVDQRVAERQVPAADRRFDEIGWAHDIRAALKLAAEHHRPVFLFTHDGRMNFGRC
jgi:hypothetical protein